MSSVLRRSVSPGWKKGALSLTPVRERPPPQQPGRCCVGDAATAGRGRRDIRAISGTANTANVVGIADVAIPVPSGALDVAGRADAACPVASGELEMQQHVHSSTTGDVAATAASTTTENAPELTQLALVSGGTQAEEESHPERTPVPVQQQLKDWAGR